MTTYVALLRAVNVGGTGKLPMADLQALCTKLGFRGVATYIASGNVVFASALAAGKVQAQLERALLAYAGREAGVFLRTAAQLRAVLDASPFADKDPRLSYVHFLAHKPGADALADCRGRVDEQLQLGEREIHVYYPGGMGQSKLRIPAAGSGTARNMNTVARLVQMSDRSRT